MTHPHQRLIIIFISDQTLFIVSMFISRVAFAFQSISHLYEKTHKECLSTSLRALCTSPSRNYSNNCQPWLTAWWSLKSLLVLLAVIWFMHSHVAHEVQPEPILSLFLWESVRAVGGCGDSAVWLCLSRAQRLCVREGNIMRCWGGVVNLSSTCSLDSGAWCEVSSARYPIDHIYYIHHSASLFWQLIAPGKEKERIGFLFEGRGILWAWAVSLHFSLLRVFRERSVTDVGSKSLLKPQLLQNENVGTVLESFLEK